MSVERLWVLLQDRVLHSVRLRFFETYYVIRKISGSDNNCRISGVPDRVSDRINRCPMINKQLMDDLRSFTLKSPFVLSVQRERKLSIIIYFSTVHFILTILFSGCLVKLKISQFIF